MSSQAHNLLLDGHRGWRAKREDELDVAAEDCGSWLAGEGGGAAGPTATSPTSCARQHPDRTSAHTTDRTPGAQRSYRRAKDKRMGGCLRAQSRFGGPGDSPLHPVAVLPAFTCADAGTWPGSEPSGSQRPQGQSADCWSRAASQTATQGESSPGWDPDVTLRASPLLPVLPGHTSRPSPRGRWWGRGRVFPPPLPPASSLLASLSTSCKCRVHMTQERSSRVWFSGAGKGGAGRSRGGKRGEGTCELAPVHR